ncbi:MAG TPA: ParA family partition ATPase [Fimbriimonadaceae bacterium]|nr:ParA family partition ATPase [Fimbriimonadaceae bacterium]
MIFSIVNQKGGVGKTTLSIHLADGLFKRGRKVALIDADAQNSSLLWSAARTGENLFPVMNMAKDTLYKEIQSLSGAFDDIVIDGPPRVASILKAAIAAADVVIVPVKPSSVDVWAATDVVQLIQEVQNIKEGLRATFVINERRPNTRLARDVEEALKQLGLEVTATSIHSRSAYAVSIGAGQTVFDIEPNGKAAAEMSRLIDELTHAPKRKA